MTKQTLRQRVAAQSERIRELEGRLRALELRLSEHCGDNTRHVPRMVPGVIHKERALPVLDPDDGAPPGTGTITTAGRYAEWSAEPFSGSAHNCAVQPVDADRVEVILEAGLATL